MRFRRLFLILLGSVALGTLAGCSNSSSSGGGGAAQPNGFRNLLSATFQHPRCQECHAFDEGNALSQRHQDRPKECSVCHTVPLWRAPIDSFSFANLSSAQICQAIKNKFGGNLSGLRDHFATSTLVNWGLVDGSLPFGGSRPTAPPNDINAFLALVDTWIANGAVCD